MSRPDSAAVRAHPFVTIEGIPGSRITIRPRGRTVQGPGSDIAEAARRIDRGTPVFDVREPDEYSTGHVPGAPLIPVGHVPDRIDDFPTTGEVLLICRSGGRSRQAAELLRSHGIDAINVDGGMLGWVE